MDRFINTPSPSGFCSRRHFLQAGSAFGLGSTALAWLLQQEGLLSAPARPELEQRTYDLKPKAGHHPASARAMISILMIGGPSQMDLFDPKPLLNQWAGKPFPGDLKFDNAGQASSKVMPGLWEFQKHGQCGTELSSLLPHLARVVDEVCVVRSMRTGVNNHGQSLYALTNGRITSGAPTLGSWLSYGLGSENSDLPAYIVLTSGSSDGQPLLQSFWGNGFLDSRHAGVPFRNSGAPVLHLANPQGVTAADRRRELDIIQWMNRRQSEALGDPEIASRIASYELAFRMQASVPALAEITDEPEHILKLYGADPSKPSFARNCLLARRLVERGVRFVQLYDRGWDSHTDIDSEHKRQCLASDQPAAALLADLKQRGLLEDTLVVWGGEFGRTPVAQVSGKTWGRDHHPHAFTMWLAGGGMKPGLTYGATDEFGYHTVENPVHIHDLHATILHQMGIDHERLTFRTQGRDFRLTDVAGKVVRSLLA